MLFSFSAILPYGPRLSNSSGKRTSQYGLRPGRNLRLSMLPDGYGRCAGRAPMTRALEICPT